MYSRFVCAWLVIIGVAAFDAYLTVKHSHVMNDVEINPFGILVLKKAGGVPALIALKTAGIALALLFCFSLWQCPVFRRKVMIATYCVAGLAVAMLVIMNIDLIRAQQRRLLAEQHRKHSALSPIPKFRPEPLVEDTASGNAYTQPDPHLENISVWPGDSPTAIVTSPL